ncbi:hypothetical protein SK128_015084, partial [Halocaridina rubra]
MQEAGPIVPLIFFIFVLSNSWVLVNLILTVIIQAFVEIKHDMLKQPNEHEVVEFVWGRFKSFLRSAKNTNELNVQGDITSSNGKLDSPVNDNDCIGEFPEKVDRFLEYINNMYFSGSLGPRSLAKFGSYDKSLFANSSKTALWNAESNYQKERQNKNDGKNMQEKGIVWDPQALDSNNSDKTDNSAGIPHQVRNQRTYMQTDEINRDDQEKTMHYGPRASNKLQ